MVNVEDIKENFKFMALPNGYREVGLEKSNQFLVLVNGNKISVETNRIMTKEPLLELRRGFVASSGRRMEQNYEKLQLPLDLTEKDFDNLKKTYFEIKNNQKKALEEFHNKNSEVKEYIPADERKEEFRKYAKKILEAKE
ncbi:MAG: hypothetical protein ACOCXG_03170 [Nanoarchaeota archaeon]